MFLGDVWNLVTRQILSLKVNAEIEKNIILKTTALKFQKVLLFRYKIFLILMFFSITVIHFRE